MTLKRKIQGLIRSYESKVVHNMIVIKNGTLNEINIQQSKSNDRMLDKIELLKKLLEK